MSGQTLEQRERRTMRFGKYEDLVHVASGGMGAVYRAVSSEDGREYALKVLKPEIAENRIPFERFLREAEAASKLRHPNIVAVHKRGKTRGTHYIAMEFVDGIDLHRYVLGGGPVKVEEAIDILVQAARALEHAHEKGIIHRDIKPSNFILSRQDGRRVVKLTDFGLAFDMSNPDGKLTRVGTTIGTVDYMAPEQARGNNLTDCRSDVYALGCTAYFMLTGSAPFPDGSVPDKLYKHVHEYPVDPRERRSGLPDEVVNLLHRMMQKLPEDRYQTMTELLQDLERLHKESRTGPPDVLAILTNGKAETAPEPRRPAFQNLPPSYEENEEDLGPVPPPAWLVVAGILAICAVIGLTLMVWLQ